MPGSIFDTTVIIPPRPITNFVYRCGKKFVYEMIESLYEEPSRQFGILRVFGEKTIVQISNEFSEIKTISVKTTKLQKKQGRGGQSKNRIERLREETVHNYLKLASEKAMAAFVKDGQIKIQALLIVGSGMKREVIKEYLQLPIPYYTYALNSEEDDISEYLTAMIKSEMDDESNIHIKYIEDLIRQQPDLLVFGAEIYDVPKLKTVYTDHDCIPPAASKVIKLRHGSLQKYGGVIGERYTVHF
jgi:hypothetical protein